MHLIVDVPVAVVYHGDHRSQQFQPLKIQWDGQVYRVTQIGLHHRTYEGRTLVHIWTVDTATISLKLAFNTETLATRLLEIHDGEAA